MPVLYLSTLKAQWGRTLLLVLFALAYASISFVNHYNFRTATLDLGLIAQAVGEVAQLRWPQTTLLLDSPPTPFLGQHFSLTPLLAVPLYYVVGGAWALLLVQTGALLLGALGVWRYAQAQGASPGVCNWALAFFASQWGIYSALSFDYHDNVVGAMALPWLALWVGQRRVGPAVAAALVVLLSKENMALWLAFVLLGLAWQHWRQRAVVAWLAAGALASLGYFVVITQVVMPALDVNHRAFTQVVRYAHLGPTLPAAVANVLLHPRLLWDVLLHNTLPDPLYDHIKRELWVAILLSGGWALVWRPWYALMLLPILGQKLLSNDFVLWGINGHYSIELAPVLALAATDALCSWRWGRIRHLAWAGALASVLLFTLDTFSTRFSRWYTPVTNNPLLPEHYTSAVPDRAGLCAALAQVPADVPLSASSSLVPHLLNRQAVYLFPVLRNARLVALLREPGEAAAWPLSPEVARQALAQFQADANYRTVYEDAQLVVLARRFAPTDSAITWKAQP
ncbi:Uncharacterized membrane protein [Hymenobacter gelipurpurascens]|uniref:Uncharacterized membrane protein n=1 Tax=Hymenobacter gelipurpurascens TaxID=89968 RepID=A0A212UEG0_9BACT|nr:DUF2079 domain-containing protein [Hymenobacter gelipurpurascens]SNC76639.1 Uncharacterized membrane protein [Hymenobacter gelipurpurascens]